MWFKHIMSIAQQLMPIYNTIVHKNKSTIDLNVANVRAISYRHQHATRAEEDKMKIIYSLEIYHIKLNLFL